MARRLANEKEANRMLTCLASLAAAIKSLAEVGTGGVVATTEAAAGRGGRQGRNVPKRQAVVADAGRDVLCPEPTNPITAADAETGRTQSSIRGGTLFHNKFDGASGSARCSHSMNGPDDIGSTDRDNTQIGMSQVSPKAVVDLVIRPVFQTPNGAAASVS